MNYTTEQQAFLDLDICGYAGKWRKAKTKFTDNQPGYWDRVRTYFLELGGCYLNQRNQ